MTTILSFLVVIGIIIFVHELGHFLAAKLSGVRVEEFSLGFPPRMIGKKIGETEYQLAWIPLGGYVRMSGMLDEGFDENYDRDDPRGFVAQPLIRKIFIITAGVLMNILLGFFIYTGIIWHEGVSELSGTTVTLVSSDYPAAEAGMQEGDKIFEINGEPIKTWQELTAAIRPRAGLPTMIRWQRGDSTMSAEITPATVPEMNMNTLETDTVGKIGVLGSIVTEPAGPFSAMKYGSLEVWWVLKLSGKSVYALVTGKAKLKQVLGPIGIAQASGETVRSGFVSFLSFIALISVSIGFLNILPIPMLDGGHLIFIIIEAVIRRRIPDKVKVNLMKIGLAGLLLLITVVSYHDIVRIFSD